MNGERGTGTGDRETTGLAAVVPPFDHRACEATGGARSDRDQKRAAESPIDRPLWQIFLTTLVATFVAQRVAVLVLLDLDGHASPALVGGYAIQCVAGAAAAVGIWLGRLWARAALLVLAVAVVGTALLEGFFLDVRPPLAALSQSLVVALASGALVLVLGREFGRADREDQS